ncbi:MAG: hypothetical protein WC850_05635 [Candidatus Gracilibacteria bacterium]
MADTSKNSNIQTQVSETPESQTETTKNQLGSLRDKVKSKVLPLTLAGAILAHGVNAPDSQANPIDVQDKPGVTQVIDTSKQQKDQLKAEVQDKVAEKEISDYYKDKKGGDKVIAKYNSLQDSHKTRVLDYYKNLDGKPMKAVSNLVTVFNNVQLGLKFVDKYKKTGEVGDMPKTIESALVFIGDFDPNGQNIFTKEELGMFDVVDKTVLGLIDSKIAEGEKTIAEGEKTIAEGEKTIAEGEKTIAEGRKTITKLEEQIRFLDKFNKALSNIN